jgi:hypothetical protein
MQDVLGCSGGGLVGHRYLTYAARLCRGFDAGAERAPDGEAAASEVHIFRR